MVYSRTKNNKLKEDVEKAIKRISIYVTDETRTLTSDEAKLREYRDTLLTAFNERYKYIRKYDTSFKEETKTVFAKAYDKYVERTINCLSILGFSIDKPKKSFDNFDTNSIIRIGPPYGHTEEEKAEKKIFQICTLTPIQVDRGKVWRQKHRSRVLKPLH